MIDLANLTLGEVSTIEDLSGRSIVELGDGSKPMGKALSAIAMIIKRRTGEPTFSWNQAQALTIPEANKLLGVGDDDDSEDSEAGKDVPSKKGAPKPKHNS